jgi:phosphoglycerate dehydrogenase-like enzyme
METINVLVAGVPYGYQGDYADGRWLTPELAARITGVSDRIRLEHLSAYEMNDGRRPDRAPHAILTETSGTDRSWDSLPAVVLGPALEPAITADLRFLQSASAGVEHLLGMLPAGLPLCNASGVHAPAIAETVMASILADAKMLYRRRADQAERAWRQRPCRELAGTTMVVLGTGDIGTETARLAKAFGMTTIGVRRTAAPVAAFDRVVTTADLLDVLPLADHLVIGCPLTDATRGIIDAGAFAALKPGAYLANVARGAIVDEKALVEALLEGRLRGAFLDCHVTEPLPADHPLWDMPGVDVSPHDSHATQLLGEHHVALFCENLRRLVAGEPFVNVVDATRGY